MKKQLTATIALQIIAGRSSPLYMQLYSNSLISDSFSVEFETVTNQSHAVFSGESNDPEAVINAIKNEITHINSVGISDKFFLQIKKSIMGSIIRSLNSFENISAGIASSYFNNCNYFDNASLLSEITKKDVEIFIKDNLTSERFAYSTVKPINI